MSEIGGFNPDRILPGENKPKDPIADRFDQAKGIGGLLKRVEETKKKRQAERVANMTAEERASWGFQPGETLQQKQKRDEDENPTSNS